jgi:phosphoadenosine phosphosulfate reductase
MGLIASRRHRPDDLEAWTMLARSDEAWGRLDRLDRLVDRALRALMAFRKAGQFYIGTSWGKDSMVVAHLAYRLRLDAKVIWFPAGQVENPDCVLVRDQFLARFDVDYIEHEVSELRWSQSGVHRVHDGAQAAFARESRRFGSRYASGIRGSESGSRKKRMIHWGECSQNTCAPIGHWALEDVYAYLARHDLPVHPAYACLWGGRLERRAIRVSTIGGTIGEERGRREWEERYYPETLRAALRLAATVGV